MKKISKLLLVCFALLLSVQTVYADVIWEPRDGFYRTHVEECYYEGRQYIVKGPEGRIILYESPISDKKVDVIGNGQSLFIEWQYEDHKGNIWGYIEGEKKGWLPVAYLEVVYDWISFEYDHADEINIEEGQIDASYMDKDIYGWKYPGSEEADQIYISGDYCPEYSQTYVDQDGRKWVNCIYYHGYRNFWMCLDNLEADYDTLYQGKPIDVIPEEIEQVPTDEVIKPEKSGNLEMVYIGIAVLAVVAVTGIVLVRVKRKK